MKNGVRSQWKLRKEEFNTQFFDADRKGDLIVHEGLHQYSIPEIAKKFGTPCEIFFPHILESRLRELTGHFTSYFRKYDYRGRFLYHYPMKVNQRKSFVRAVVSEGGNLETSSVNELWLVKRLWERERFSSRIRVLCNGPKTPEYRELIKVLDQGGLTITPVVEEAGEIDHFAKYRGEIGVRVDMDIKIRSHWDKKYNHFGIREQQLLSLGKIRNLAILSFHVSSQIEKVEDFALPIKRAVSIYAQMQQRNPRLDTINIGGGGGVPYVKRRFYTGKSAVQRVVATFKHACAKAGVREPNIICEWGRYIAAPSQITVYDVMTEKAVAEGKPTQWYFVNGSIINDMPDTWAIHQKWHVIPANNMGVRSLRNVWLAGSSCDSDDKYTAAGRGVPLPKLDGEDRQLVAFLDTGAYQDSLGGRHCLISRPAQVIAQDGELRLARKRDSSEDLGKMFGW